MPPPSGDDLSCLTARNETRNKGVSLTCSDEAEGEAERSREGRRRERAEAEGDEKNGWRELNKAASHAQQVAPRTPEKLCG